MAMKMKSWYVTVLEGYKQIYQRKCMSAKEATAVHKELKEMPHPDDPTQLKYPKEKYQVLREEW